MTPTEIEQAKLEVIEEAKTWLKTPYHHMARVKGAGCDCLTFIVEVYSKVGLIPEQPNLPFYRGDFMRHNGDETYLNGFLLYGDRVSTPEIADIVLYKWGRVYSHGGIVINWPTIYHSVPGRGVMQGFGDQGRLDRNHLFIRPKCFLEPDRPRY